MNTMRVENRKGGWVVTQHRGMGIWMQVKNTPVFDYESDAITCKDEMTDEVRNGK